MSRQDLLEPNNRKYCFKPWEKETSICKNLTKVDGFYYCPDCKKQLKHIVSFDERDYGLFISTQFERASVSVDKQTGEIFLDEGVEDGYFNTFIHPRNFKGFFIKEIKKDLHSLNISFGLEEEHFLGLIENYEKNCWEVKSWIEKANNYIRGEI